MRELLIIFVILLVLLMLISTFGGSIRQKESFVQAVPSVEEAEEKFDMMPPSFIPPAPPTPMLKKVDYNIEPFDNLHSYAQVEL